MPQVERRYEKPEQDGRVKIPPERYEEVRQQYKFFRSYQKTADYFHVSKRLIIFICNPEKLEEFKRNRKGKWVEYYETEKRREDMRKYRAKKRKMGFLGNANRPKRPCNCLKSPCNCL